MWTLQNADTKKYRKEQFNKKESAESYVKDFFGKKAQVIETIDSKKCVIYSLTNIKTGHASWGVDVKRGT